MSSEHWAGAPPPSGETTDAAGESLVEMARRLRVQPVPDSPVVTGTVIDEGARAVDHREPTLPPDPEIQAMREIVRVMQGLTEEGRRTRVLDYVVDRFGLPFHR